MYDEHDTEALDTTLDDPLFDVSEPWYDLSDPSQWPDHWTEDGAPQEQLQPGDSEGLVRIRTDDATTEEVYFPDGTVIERPRTHLEATDLLVADDDDGPLGAARPRWVNGTKLPRVPLWTPQQAVAQAKMQTTRDTCPHYGDYDGLCLHFTACMYGFASSGTYDAATHWRLMPNEFCHPEDRNPPLGALVYWYGGSAGHGHISIVVAPGMIASNDIRVTGRISVVPLGEIEQKWGQDYKGWTPPYFARAWGTNGQTPVRPEKEKSPWAEGTVYVSKLRAGQRNSDSVKRLKYRLRHHPDLPAARRNGIGMSRDKIGDYGPGLVDAVRYWQRQVAGVKGDGTLLTEPQANRLFGKNYRVIEDHRKAGRR
jgi:hypothetical protein